MADEGVAIKLGAFEQEALIDGFSTSASAGLNGTLNSLSKWLVAAVFGIVFLWRHDGEALWAASGSVLNAGLSTVLKRVLNQERPVSTIRSDPGMPSTHAQSIFYTVMFCIVSMVEYFGLNGITAVISALILAIGSYLSWLRVWQQLHTTSQSKWLVAALFGVIFLWRHDAEALWAASGSVLNAGLSTVLKRILNQERPVSTIRSDPGMPSSHAQSIFFTVTFCIVSMVEYFGLNGTTAVISTLIFAIGSYFSWLRVSQQLHTTSQVVVGATLGFCYSIFWFWLWDAIVLEAFISHLWVRILVALGSVAICARFLLYVIRYWVLEEINIYY